NAEEMRRLTGQDSAIPAAFEVDGPWILEWRTRSEFPKSASFEMRLRDAATGDHLGMITAIKGLGKGQKLFDESGKFQLVIVATGSEWDILIRQVSAPRAAAIRRQTTGSRTLLDAAQQLGRRVPEGSFESWRPEGDNLLLLFSDGNIRWTIRFLPPCKGLGESTAISFMTAIAGAAGEYDSILLDDGTRCGFDSVIPGSTR
ncbi:MAG: hypothetical protein ACR2QR_14435, partial [Woeseiaceae bacterium]